MGQAVGRTLEACLRNQPEAWSPNLLVTPEPAFHLFHDYAPQIFIMEFPNKEPDQKGQRSSRLFILLQDSARRRWVGAIPGV